MTVGYTNEMLNQPTTLLFYDYETFGKSPKFDRPCQFAAIRTNEHLDVIEDPIELYCKPTIDYLPAPEACLVHGITPQMALKKGKHEPEFIDAIRRELARTNTCSVGYNNIRFDNQVTRNSLYRNLHCPYDGLHSDGQSQWDILHLARAFHALRPEGIQWPIIHGKPSFKLEELAQANAISHNAHDALSDVVATLEMAKRMKASQPKLFDWMFAHRTNRQIYQFVQRHENQPMLFIDPVIGSSQSYCTLVLCVGKDFYPGQDPNVHTPHTLYCVDLLKDLTPLFTVPIDELNRLLYTKSGNTTPSNLRPPVYRIKTNQSPSLLPFKGLLPEDAIRLGLNLDTFKQNMGLLQRKHSLEQTVKGIYGHSTFDNANLDVDERLYDGVYSWSDKRFLRDLRTTEKSPESCISFENCDPRVEELYLRYNGRYHSESLTPEEEKQWHAHLKQRIGDRYPDYMRKLESMMDTHTDRSQSILLDVAAYARELFSHLEESVLGEERS